MKKIDRILQDWRIKKAVAYIGDNEKVLDIGTYDGTLFKKVKNLVSGIGIEPELDPTFEPPSSVEFRKGFFPEVLKAEETFNSIAMLAVLEHIKPEDQVTMAKEIYNRLEPGGKLIITVPSPFVDVILDVLMFLKLIDGMETDEHYGFKPADTIPLFEQAGLNLHAKKTFQLGLNNLFVFTKTS